MYADVAPEGYKLCRCSRCLVRKWGSPVPFSEHSDRSAAPQMIPVQRPVRSSSREMCQKSLADALVPLYHIAALLGRRAASRLHQPCAARPRTTMTLVATMVGSSARMSLAPPTPQSLRHAQSLVVASPGYLEL